MIELLNVYKLFNTKFKKSFWVLIFLTLVSVILETIGIGIIIPLISLFTSNKNSDYFIKIKRFLEIFDKNITNNQVIFICLFVIIFFFALKNIFLTFYFWFQNTLK